MLVKKKERISAKIVREQIRQISAEDIKKEYADKDALLRELKKDDK